MGQDLSTIQVSNFTQTCGSRFNCSSAGVVDSHGNPLLPSCNVGPGVSSLAFGITYQACIDNCNSSLIRQNFQFVPFAAALSSWIFPFLFLLAQFPQESQRAQSGLGILYSFGSPMLITYSLVITLLMRYHIDRKFEPIINKAKAVSKLAPYLVKRAYYARSFCLDTLQVPMRVSQEDGWLASLIVLPDNTLFWAAVAKDLANTRRAVSASLIAQTVFAVIAYVFTVISAVAELGDAETSENVALSSIFLWMVPILWGYIYAQTASAAGVVQRSLHDKYINAIRALPEWQEDTLQAREPQRGILCQHGVNPLSTVATATRALSRAASTARPARPNSTHEDAATYPPDAERSQPTDNDGDESPATPVSPLNEDIYLVSPTFTSYFTHHSLPLLAQASTSRQPVTSSQRDPQLGQRTFSSAPLAASPLHLSIPMIPQPSYASSGSVDATGTHQLPQTYPAEETADERHQLIPRTDTFDKEKLMPPTFWGRSIEGDERIEGPVFNYARVFTHWHAVSKIADGFSGTLKQLGRPLAVRKQINGAPWDVLNTTSMNGAFQGTAIEVSRYAGMDSADFDLPVRLELDIRMTIVLAIAFAILLPWATIGSGVWIAFRTPAAGLGCRSGSYLLYAINGTLAFILMATASFLSRASMIRYQHNYHRSNGQSLTTHHEIPRPHRRRQFANTHDTARIFGASAVIFRSLGKFVAVANVGWTVAFVLMQLTGAYETCWCLANLPVHPSKNSWLVLFKGGQQLADIAKSTWIGGIALATIVCIGCSLVFRAVSVKGYRG